MSHEPASLPNESLRKAAVLIRSLPPEAAATLLGRLSAEEAASLRASIADLGEVDAKERAGVADEILGVAQEPVSASESEDGVELQIGSSEPPPSPGDPPEPVETDPFRLIADADPATIASYLSGERPRAAALVLSYLPADLASTVLDEYGDERQVELLTQMSELGEADPASVRIIAADLAAWVGQKSEQQRRQNDRLAAVRGVLEVAGDARRRRLATRLLERDPKVAQRLGLATPKPAAPKVKSSPRQPAPETAPPEAPALAFDDLERLPGKDLVTALGQIGARAAVLALAGASEPLLRRVESALPKKSAKEMRKRIAQIGQTTLAEVEASQRALATAAERIVVARRVSRVAAMN